MSEKALNLLGLMRRANAIAIGETNTGAAVRGGRAKLLLVAADASDNARRRAEGFAAGSNAMIVSLPYVKEEISSHVGVSGCSMAAVLDIGFAGALMKELAGQFPEKYGAMAQTVFKLDAEARMRRAATAARGRKKKIGKGGIAYEHD